MKPIPDLDGVALQRSDPGFADECLGYNRLVTHRPEVVVGAASAHDVAAAVRHAREHGWSVGVASTGHGPTRPVTGVLVTTRRMTGVSVDPDAGTATVQAGTRAGDVVAAAAKHGLAPLNGSAPHVGFVGYTLGGGVPLLGRQFGYAVDQVRRVELVTADGERRTLHRDDGDPLLWAILGGKDNFGIVTELEVDLVAVREITGGGLWWTGAAVPDAVRRWVRWAGDLPDHLGTSVLVIGMPDLDVIPAPLRGQHVAHVRLLHVGDRSDADQLVSPLRTAPGIVQDTFTTMEYANVGTIHAEPSVPVRFEARSSLLGRLDDDAADVIARGTGPDSGFMTELRLLGGRLADPPRRGVASRRDGRFSLYTGTALTADDTSAAAAERQARLHDALAAWGIGAPLLAFLSGPNRSTAEIAAAYGRDDFEVLRRMKTEVDPTNVFRNNLNIPPLDT